MMNILREQLSAWAIVAVLGGALVAVWGVMPPSALQGDAALACTGSAVQTRAAQLPRGTGWAPDAALAGLPQVEDIVPDYEDAEARNLARHDGTRSLSATSASGSRTSLNPIARC